MHALIAPPPEEGQMDSGMKMAEVSMTIADWRAYRYTLSRVMCQPIIRFDRLSAIGNPQFMTIPFVVIITEGVRSRSCLPCLAINQSSVFL